MRPDLKVFRVLKELKVLQQVFRVLKGLKDPLDYRVLKVLQRVLRERPDLSGP